MLVARRCGTFPTDAWNVHFGNNSYGHFIVWSYKIVANIGIGRSDDASHRNPIPEKDWIRRTSITKVLRITVISTAEDFYAIASL